MKGRSEKKELSVSREPFFISTSFWENTGKYAANVSVSDKDMS